MTKLEEMLQARQAPGMIVSSPVRSAVLRDGNGGVTRVLYGGGVTTARLEKDMVKCGEQDGLDLSRARLSFTEEKGQGLGKRQAHSKDAALRLPKPNRNGN